MKKLLPGVCDYGYWGSSVRLDSRPRRQRYVRRLSRTGVRTRNASTARSTFCDFELILVDPQSFDFGIESTCRNTELGRSTRTTRYTAVAFRQCRFNHLFLLCEEDVIKRKCRIGNASGGRVLEPGLVH